MSKSSFYSIGSPGNVWQQTEKNKWLAQAIKSRSYLDEIVQSIKQLDEKFQIVQYGSLSFNPNAFPLFALKSRHWNVQNPIVLITGGVHGYETSGVAGALDFAVNHANKYAKEVNFLIMPCISPWGYEHIARWNPNAVDPNRCFYTGSPSEEAQLAMAFVKQLESTPLLHIDLHETTDSDESEFRPALAARDGENFIPDIVPDGFYLVGDSKCKQVEFQQAIIERVKQVTHIAPADKDGNIIGSEVEQEGIIYYDVRSLGLCTSMTDAAFTTITEVYPDSPTVTVQDCNNAQVAAIEGALNYVLKNVNNKR